MISTVPPRILLAEDDPVSRAFLMETLRRLGCAVSAVEDGTQALGFARERSFDLLILDRSLPGLRGDRVLQALRADANSVSRDATAIATTAEPDEQVHAALRGAGFARVLMKPLRVELLRQALGDFGLRTNAAGSAALDDAAGLAASGSGEILSALRGLFATELDTLAREFDELRLNPAALGERLHRLRAACGFCGATLLQTAAAELSDALHGGDPVRIAECSDAFLAAFATTRDALQP